MLKLAPRRKKDRGNFESFRTDITIFVLNRFYKLFKMKNLAHEVTKSLVSQEKGITLRNDTKYDFNSGVKIVICNCYFDVALNAHMVSLRSEDYVQ